MSKHLIIFAKPPVLGYVKTRLAQAIGNENALKFYQRMLEQTWKIAQESTISTTVFFSKQSEYVSNFKLFPVEFQSAGDLGKKMAEAFTTIFAKGYREVILIGADCPDNTTENILNAFELLQKNDTVIGPSEDGGYYLIGMKKMYSEIFDNKVWSTSTVCQEAIQELEKINLSIGTAATLNDIDTWEDLKKSKFYRQLKTID